MRISKEDLERLKATPLKPPTSEFGTITLIDYWPVVDMVYDPDGQPPQIHGRKEILTVTEPEGGEPEISGVEPVGEVFLTKTEVAAIPGWVAVEKKIKEGLEAKWQKQQEALAPPPPPTA